MVSPNVQPKEVIKIGSHRVTLPSERVPLPSELIKTSIATSGEVVENLKETRAKPEHLKLKNTFKALGYGAAGIASDIIGSFLLPVSLSAGVVIGAIIGFGKGVKVKMTNRYLYEKYGPDSDKLEKRELSEKAIRRNIYNSAKIGAFGFFILANTAFGKSEEALKKTRKAFEND
jgi:hypothetical protein